MVGTAAVIVLVWLVVAAVLAFRLGPILRRASQDLPLAPPPDDRQE